MKGSALLDRAADAPRDLPIIFSGPMVRALLDGRKTMTRRLAWRETNINREPTPGATVISNGTKTLTTTSWLKAKPGDRLWVRESWQDYCPIWDGQWCGHGDAAGVARDHQPVYLADPLELQMKGPQGKEMAPSRWRPSIHMPRWASRLTLTVTAIKVERLQEISEEDASAEGVYTGKDGDLGPLDLSARALFADLWKSLHGADSWRANPEVVALTFTVEKRNIDQIEAPP